MKIYIWEDGGISDGFHDDGTLVVLAHGPDEARRLVREQRAAHDADEAQYTRDRDDWLVRAEAAYEAQVKAWADAGDPRSTGSVFWYWLYSPVAQVWREKDPEPPMVNHDAYIYALGWDGSDEALARTPDREIDLATATPQVVAFNGGGYD